MILQFLYATFISPFLIEEEKQSYNQTINNKEAA